MAIPKTVPTLFATRHRACGKLSIRNKHPVWLRKWQSTGQAPTTSPHNPHNKQPELQGDIVSPISDTQDHSIPQRQPFRSISTSSSPFSLHDTLASHHNRPPIPVIPPSDKPGPQTPFETNTTSATLSNSAHAVPRSGVATSIPGLEFKYHPIFLRDSCICPKCVDPSTRQKLFTTVDIPADIAVKDAKLTSHNAVELTWLNDMPGYPSDHVTTLDIDFLRNSLHNKHLHRRAEKWFWNVAEFERSQTFFDYNQYMSDDSVLFQALTQLRIFGLVFLSDVPETEASVSNIATRIGPLKNTFYGSTWDVRSVAGAKNVAYTSQDLGFHMDLLYMHQPPRWQLLHCLRASTEGGTSLFTDAYRAAQTLLQTDPEAACRLASSDVNFHYDNDSQHYHQARKVFQLKGNKKLLNSRNDMHKILEAVNWSPPFQAPFSHNSDDGSFSQFVQAWHKDARKFRDLVEHKDVVYKRQMPPGECVIFDNQRVLHARTAFSGGERWLRGAYLDSDPFTSKLRVLNRQFGPQRRG